jgi:hypothetical protein
MAWSLSGNHGTWCRLRGSLPGLLRPASVPCEGRRRTSRRNMTRVPPRHGLRCGYCGEMRGMLNEQPSRRVIAEPLRAVIAGPTVGHDQQRRTTCESAPAPRLGSPRPEEPVPATA